MYKYELHLHTSEGSLCARSSGADVVDFYIKNGYSGAVITDHFYHGNTRPDRTQSWQDYIDEFVTGYEKAKKAAEGRDFDIFFGLEERLSYWDEYLVYGVTPDFLKAHPELRDFEGEDFLSFMHNAGAFIIHAHPYRERPYMHKKHIMLRPNAVDAIEVHNCSNKPEFNRRAYEYAKRIGLPMTGGSDCHEAVGDRLGGVALPCRCDRIEDLIAAIRTGKAEVLRLNEAIEAPLSEPTFSVEVV